MMSRLRLTVVRHGESTGNVAGLLQGVTDGDLTPHGITQAVRLGDRLAQAGWRFDAAYCSDLRRAHKTALVALSRMAGEEHEPHFERAIGRGVHASVGRTVLHVDRRLRERDYGSLENLKYAKADRSFWQSRRGGESNEDVQRRALRLVQGIFARHLPMCCDTHTTIGDPFIAETEAAMLTEPPSRPRDGVRSVLLVSHGDFISSILNALAHHSTGPSSHDATRRMFTINTAVHVVEIDCTRGALSRTVVLENCAVHLNGLAKPPQEIPGQPKISTFFTSRAQPSSSSAQSEAGIGGGRAEEDEDGVGKRRRVEDDATGAGNLQQKL